MAPVNQILFLDIETVPCVSTYEELPAGLRELWREKALKFFKQDAESSDDFLFFQKAGLYAEFGKIICISVAYLSDDIPPFYLKVKSISGDNERQILSAFSDMLDKMYEVLQHKNADAIRFLCAHNGREFDFPYLCRRLLINGMPLPSLLNIQGKKPWEVNHLDTMDLWSFGDYKNYTPLKLLAEVLGLVSPKDDIEGKDVANVYWRERDLERIRKYCQKDTVTVAQVLLRMRGLPVVLESDISYSD